MIINYAMHEDAYGCSNYRTVGGENSLSLCFNEGKIIGRHTCGGICGWFDTRKLNSASGEGIIETCINIGDIESRDSQIRQGGIIGGAQAIDTGFKVLRCINLGKFIRYT